MGPLRAAVVDQRDLRAASPPCSGGCPWSRGRNRVQLQTSIVGGAPCFCAALLLQSGIDIYRSNLEAFCCVHSSMCTRIE